MSIRDSNNSPAMIPWFIAIPIIITVLLAAIGAGNGVPEDDPVHQCKVHNVCPTR